MRMEICPIAYSNRYPNYIPLRFATASSISPHLLTLPSGFGIKMVGQTDFQLIARVMSQHPFN